MSASYRIKPTDDELLAAVREDDADVAASAATVLGLRGDARALDALLGLLNHEHPSARSAAASALGLLGLESAIPPLQAACMDVDPGVATAASLALQRFGVECCGAAAYEHLVSELHTDDPERRGLAARALGGLGSEAAVEPLIERLSDADASVRADAAGSLGWLGVERAVPNLMSVGFADPDERVRKVAMHAVARLVVPETPL